jgi:hypothetical protein
VDVRMIDGWDQRLADAVDDFMDHLAEDVRSDASRFAPVDTGRLSTTIVSYRHGERTWRVHARAPYAAWVELGTLPHTIRPVNARALRWINESGIHFASIVHHPGTRAQPFLRPALTAARG